MTLSSAWQPLRPFAPSSRGVSLRASVRREGNSLSFAFRLEGALASLALPALLPPGSRARRDELWQATCFELFWGAPGEPSYHELNLAPSGDWNLYRFSGYREGMAPEEAAPPEISTEHRQNQFLAQGCVDARITGPLEAALTAVLQYNDGAREFWALAHKGEKPDFHRRDGFALQIP